ncbi:bifunctional metallophosphatase/5'-nucleotidase [Actinoalloteichus hymeniacidonis]|uniref:5'-nucleotidase/2',3'-cyclic phosphodiesterase-like hydrolase n=1 Tax=Actinoalloteichus hymeniacidonis TaxID=340345 RepID=A0AAC9HM54_9PSEU|nr:5'-nucleotidase C-terminal domain-containing protein [Actinoalloteichus hymeniacidonis]AOS61857.1 5'-nucleotidase/2',3'-cyclic phosphodiesterase-like hydrolase [Actinoalloteichus hymeniacidonis]MBB5910123.1 5'-nucleotidase [Actinoalloteichus hymeniacidonis]
MHLPRPVRNRAGRALIATSLAALTMAAVAAPASADRWRDRPAYSLTVLFTNDGESQLLGVDADIDGDGTIAPDEQRSFGGVARNKTLMDDLRRDAISGRVGPDTALRRGVLVVSGGDNYLPGPEFAASTDKGAPYYDALAFKAMRYDASAIGNHEFDFGPEVLAEFMSTFRNVTKFVGSNLDVSAEPSLTAYTENGTLVSSHVSWQAGKPVGIIGLTTPDLPSLSSPRGVEVRDDLAGIANGLAEEFEARGVDQVVLLSHLQDIDNELALAPELSGIDAIVGAGGGEILADSDVELIPGDAAEREFPLVAQDRDGRDVPVVTTTGNYKYIGRLVLHFDRQGNLLGYDDDKSEPVRVSGVGDDAVRPDRRVQRTVEEPVEEYIAGLAETTVAQSEVPLDGVRDAVRTRETNLGNLLADAIKWSGTQQAEEYGVPAPQVGIQNGGGIRNDSTIPAGAVTELNTYDVAPFANFVSVLPEVPRDTLRQLLERGVAGAPGAAGQFIQVAGLRFEYDATQVAQEIDANTGEILTPGERVRSIVLDDGTVLVADGEVVAGEPISVVTNDFSARGGDGYPLGGLDFTPVGKTYQQAFNEYLRDGLSGAISAEQYPVGGEGRITAIG